MKGIINFIRYNRILKDVYKNEHFVEGISQMMGTEFRVDRLNRIYAVLNPHVQNMKQNGGDQSLIYQYNDNNTMSNSIDVERWVMEKLNISRMFMRDTNMFELMSYNIKKLDDDNNFLIVFKNVYTDMFLKELKIYSAVLLALVIAALLIAII